MKKTYRFKKIVAFSKCVLIMLQVCLHITWRGLRGTITREWVDKKCREWSTRLLATAQVCYQVYNLHDVQLNPGERYIVMCNHTSQFDIPLIFLALPGSLRLIAKRELNKIPLLGRAMRMAEFPTIDRKNREQAIKDLQQIEELMSTGLVMGIYPEGTRSLDGNLLPLKKGGFMMAINTKAKIIPVGIRAAHKILPAKTTDLNFNQQVDIYIGEPIDAADYDIEQRDKLIARVREALLDLLAQEK